ncbi:xylose isomerase-like protein [Lipomyces japonicus]|uniref:xylose isomerase-like protein n=1 Tax=Lipomyces japonicus TaxID=56871 RepID=UPI0034CD7A4E
MTTVKKKIKTEKTRLSSSLSSSSSSSSSEKEAMFVRTTGLRMFVGAHVGAAKGVQNSILNINKAGGNSFALFVRNQKRWQSPPLKIEDIKEFQRLASEHNYDLEKHVVPHGSYLINLANLDDEKNAIAFAGFLDELNRCEQLGIHKYNLHPGSTLGLNRKDALARLANNINKAISQTKFVKILLENMAGHGNLIGSTWQDLRDVIDMVEDKSRVGVCLDTCHTFAAGYDITTQDKFDKVWQEFDQVIGLGYLQAVHVNDSKAPLGSNRDLHQNIGLGFLRLETFRVLMNTPHLQDVPLILETPTGGGGGDDSVDTYGQEIKRLEWLIGKHGQENEFLAEQSRLSELGAAERARFVAAAEAAGSKRKRAQAKLPFTRKKDSED